MYELIMKPNRVEMMPDLVEKKPVTNRRDIKQFSKFLQLAVEMKITPETNSE